MTFIVDEIIGLIQYYHDDHFCHHLVFDSGRFDTDRIGEVDGTLCSPHIKTFPF